MDASHHMGIRELDLRTCSPNSFAERINAVPGLKTSTAFFTFLRDNLVLNPSAMSSNTSTPYLAPSSSQTLPPPSPAPLVATTPSLTTTTTAPKPRSRAGSRAGTTTTAAARSAAASQPADPLDGIPPLSLSPLASRADKAAALRLIADSVAQQRQQAATHLIFHPLPLSGLVLTLGVAYRLANPRTDPGGALALAAGVIMAYLLAIRYATAGYLRAAEAINWEWLRADPEDDNAAIPSSAASSGSASSGGGSRGGAWQPTDEDILIGAHFGSELVGALALRLEQPSAGRRRSRTLKGGKGVVRAWTTKLRYRGKGVGGDLLAEAVRVTRERCGRDATVGFASEHANAAVVLPEMFSGPVRKGERRAARKLEAVLGDGRRKR